MKFRRIALSIIPLLSLTACGLVDFDEFSFYDTNSSSETNSVQQSEMTSEKTESQPYSEINSEKSSNQPSSETFSYNEPSDYLERKNKDAIMNKISEYGNFTATLHSETEYSGILHPNYLVDYHGNEQLAAIYKYERDYTFFFNGNGRYKRNETKSYTINEADSHYLEESEFRNKLNYAGYTISGTTVSKTETLYEGAYRNNYNGDEGHNIYYAYNQQLQRLNPVGQHAFGAVTNLDWFYFVRDIISNNLYHGYFYEETLSINFYPSQDFLNQMADCYDIPEIKYASVFTLYLKDRSTPKKLVIESNESVNIFQNNDRSFEYDSFNSFKCIVTFSNIGSTTPDIPDRVVDSCVHHELRNKCYDDWDNDVHEIRCENCSLTIGMEEHTFDPTSGRCIKCNHPTDYRGEYGPVIASNKGVYVHLYFAEINRDDTYNYIVPINCTYDGQGTSEMDDYINSVHNGYTAFGYEDKFYQYFPAVNMVAVRNNDVSYSLPSIDNACWVYSDRLCRFYINVDPNMMLGPTEECVAYINSLTPYQEMSERRIEEKHETNKEQLLEDGEYSYFYHICDKCGEIYNCNVGHLLGEESASYITAREFKEALDISSISVLKQCRNHKEDDFLYVKLEYSIAEDKEFYVIDKACYYDFVYAGKVLYCFEGSHDADYWSNSYKDGSEASFVLNRQTKENAPNLCEYLEGFSFSFSQGALTMFENHRYIPYVLSITDTSVVDGEYVVTYNKYYRDDIDNRYYDITVKLYGDTPYKMTIEIDGQLSDEFPINPSL